MQTRNIDTKPKGRRFTLEEKILALSIYKRSPQCYRYLASILTLPSPSLLKNLLRKIPIDTGISPLIKARLKQAADDMKDNRDKACIIMWDEVSLKAHLDYNPATDKVIGFEDWGEKRTTKYADHAIVFMLRGIRTGWKMPISYGFCDNQTKGDQLTQCIKDVVLAVKDCGLITVATVCDQGASNRTAIKNLKRDTARLRGGQESASTYGTIVIHGVEIVPLYDPPHLIKGFRNNMLNKYLEYEWKEGTPLDERKFASWDHVKKAYSMDINGHKLDRSMPTVTEAHIDPEKYNRKMSVRHATQILSRTVSTFIETVSKFDGPMDTSVGPLQMPKEAYHTAYVLHFLNKLTDAINGTCKKDRPCAFRTPITENSFHHEFFKEARRVLRGMRFVDKKTKKPVSGIPCLKNMMDTVEGLGILFKKLKTLGFRSVNPRHLNQDPLENFFGSVRSFGFRNINPTCAQFAGIYKALLINNLTSCQSRNTNCQRDDGRFLLNFKTLLQSNIHDKDIDENCEESKINIEQNVMPLPEKSNIYSSRAQLTRYLIKGVPSLKTCAECMDSLKKHSIHSSGITYATETHTRAKKILRSAMPKVLPQVCIKKQLTCLLKQRLSFDFFDCGAHKKQFLSKFYSVCVNLSLLSVLGYLNKVLNGTIVPRYSKSNVFLTQAICKYKKKLHKKSR